MNGKVNWLRVLSRMGVTPLTSVLPAVTDCPLCGGHRLYVYQDTLSGGEWHHCRSCGSTGDMISLSARYWKLDLAAAAGEVADRAGAAEIRDHVARGAVEAARLKVAAGARAADPGRLKPLLQHLYLTPVPGDRWAERLGRFCGVTGKRDVEAAMMPNAEGRYHSYRRPFTGKAWGDVLAVPFQDLPGRVRGFWCHGADDNRAFAESREEGADVGFGFLDVLGDGEHPDFGRTVFVVNDTLTALRLHDKHFQQAARALPLLSCHAQGKMSGRLDSGLLAGREAVFWGRTTTRELLRQAKLGDGLVASADAITEPMDRYFNRFTAKTWLLQTRESAVHWTLALEAFVRDQPDPEAEATLAFMALSEVERRRFFDAVAPDTRDRLLALYGGNATTRTVEMDGFRVTEADGAWTAVNPARRHRLYVTDAPFRIERVVQFPDRDTAEYHICATFRGREVRFTAPVREFDRSPLSTVRDEVRRAGVGLVAYSPEWQSRAVAVAAAFRQPEFVRGADRCGWSEPHGAWVFAGFSVGSDGTVSREPTRFAADNGTPTLDLAEPTAPHPDDVSLLSRRDGPGQVVWATAAAVAANLVAPVANRPTSGIALVGAGAQFLGPAVARQLGCARYSAFAYHNGQSAKTSAQYAAERERGHGWPVVFEAGAKWCPREVFAYLRAPGRRNALVPLDPLPAAVLGVHGGWHAIEYDPVVTSAAEYAAAVPLIVPAFLKWFAGRGLALDPAATFGESVLDAMADWFADVGGDPLAVNAARDRVRFDADGQAAGVVERFVALVGRLAPDGPAKKIPFIERIEGDNLFIPQAKLNKLLADRGGLTLEPMTVTRALIEEGALVRELDRGDPAEPGWVVGGAWWSKRHESWKRLHNRRLRLVS